MGRKDKCCEIIGTCTGTRREEVVDKEIRRKDKNAR